MPPPGKLKVWKKKAGKIENPALINRNGFEDEKPSHHRKK